MRTTLFGILTAGIFTVLFGGYFLLLPFSPFNGVPLTTQLLREPEILEATFRFQFANNASALKSEASAYCISVGATNDKVKVTDDEPGNPPLEFLSRLSDVRPIVRAYSECFLSEQGVTDRATGTRALIFHVRSMACAGISKCEVEGGYYEGNLSSSGETYFLEQLDGVWVVVRTTLNWIS